MSLDIGQLLRLRTMTSIYGDGHSSITWKPKEKGMVAVVALLGYEPAKSPAKAAQVSPHDVNRALGWVLVEDVEAALVGLPEQQSTLVLERLDAVRKAASSRALVQAKAGGK